MAAVGGGREEPASPASDPDDLGGGLGTGVLLFSFPPSRLHCTRFVGGGVGLAAEGVGSFFGRCRFPPEGEFWLKPGGSETLIAFHSSLRPLLPVHGAGLGDAFTNLCPPALVPDPDSLGLWFEVARSASLLSPPVSDSDAPELSPPSPSSTSMVESSHRCAGLLARLSAFLCFFCAPERFFFFFDVGAADAGAAP